MAEIWTIKGVAGGGIDATERTLSQLGIEQPKLVFANLAADTLTWYVTLDGLTVGSELVPTYKQAITLYRNGTRFFRGHCTAVVQSCRRIDVTVSGIWWWLDKMFLATSQTDGTGATGTRASWAFPAQSPTTSLASILTLARTMGCEFDVGTLAATFNAPQMRLSQMSFAAAVAEICRVTPDLTLWWDYSVTGAWPQARTSRRLYADAVTLDAEALEDGWKLQPQIALNVSQVNIPYLVRAADGAKQFAMQTSGTAALGQVQILTVSGDEMDTFLPLDSLESYGLQTMPLTTVFDGTGGFQFMDPSLKQLFDTYGKGADSSYGWGMPVSLFYAGADGNSPVYLPPYACKNSAGVNLDPGSYHLIISASPPSWLTAQGIAVTLTQWFIMLELPANKGYSPTYSAWLSQAPNYGCGPTSITHTLTNPQPTYNWAVNEAKLSGWVLPNALGHTAMTTVYQPMDYGFVAPPSGFSDGLLAAQNYTPVAGTLELIEEDCGGTRYMPLAINVANAGTQFTGMRAMLSSEELELDAGKTTLILGAPARFSYSDLCNRMRGSSNDNIIYV